MYLGLVDPAMAQDGFCGPYPEPWVGQSALALSAELLQAGEIAGDEGLLLGAGRALDLLLAPAGLGHRVSGIGHKQDPRATVFGEHQRGSPETVACRSSCFLVPDSQYPIPDS